MVKSIIYTLTAIALCATLFVFTEYYLSSQFGIVYDAANALYDKIEGGEATAADAEALRMLWEDKKSKLHIFIPHSDIAQIDLYLAQADGHIREGDMGLALAKTEVIKRLAQSLPCSYSVKLENVF